MKLIILGQIRNVALATKIPSKLYQEKWRLQKFLGPEELHVL